MKKIIFVLAILGNALSASAALLEQSDLTGRLMVMDQAEGKLQGVVELTAKNTMHMTVTVASKPLDCSGRSNFDLGKQMISATLVCTNGKSVSTYIDLKNIEIIPYLQDGLASAKIGIGIRNSQVAPAKSIFNGAADIKKLN